VRTLQPIQGEAVEVVGRDAQAVLVPLGDFVSPSPNAYAGGAQGVQGAERLVGFHEPIVLQCVRHQEDRTRSSGCHRRVQKAGTGAFRWSTRHVRGPFLVVAQMDQRLALQPQVSGGRVGWLTFVHATTTGRSLMTAPMVRGSVVREFHTLDGVFDGMTFVGHMADNSHT
jgi:hypothetical protein